MLSAFEYLYLGCEPFLPPLYRRVRRLLAEVVTHANARDLDLLDVGGRKSHYTIGLPVRVTVTELPRATSVQHEWNLGLTEEAMSRMYARRTNVRDILFDDMTRTRLSPFSFDIVVSVEVLEHVEEDLRFVENVCRVLRRGGVFVMTTPNGDYIPPTHPDHKRHYRRADLETLLREFFEDVRVEYSIVGGRSRSLGLRPWSVRRPWRTALSMAGNLVNAIQSARPAVAEQAWGTHHLLAVARKAS